jgi:hypothetical protein
MITLNKDNGKNTNDDNRYIYNLLNNSDNNIIINSIIIDCDLLLKFDIGMIGRNDFDIVNPIKKNNIIKLNIELLPGNNYFFCKTANNVFEIIIDNENILLGEFSISNIDNYYVSNTTYNYDLNIPDGEYWAFCYINDPNKNNQYILKTGENVLEQYYKYDNFYNFIGNINIKNNEKATINKTLNIISIEMKSNIDIIDLILIGDNEVTYNNDNNDIKYKASDKFNYLGVLNYYQKLFETEYSDSYLNSKSVIIKSPYYWIDKDNNDYINNINVNYNDNVNNLIVHNETKYEIIFGGDIKRYYNNSITLINLNDTIIDTFNNKTSNNFKNAPLNEFTSTNTGDKLLFGITLKKNKYNKTNRRVKNLVKKHKVKDNNIAINMIFDKYTLILIIIIIVLIFIILNQRF